MIRLLIVLLITVPTTSWVSVVSHRLASPALFATSKDRDDANAVSRRQAIASGFATAGFLIFSPPTPKHKQPSSWPYAPSPLPSVARSAAELSSVSLSYEPPQDPLAVFGKELSGLKSVGGYTLDSPNMKSSGAPSYSGAPTLGSAPAASGVAPNLKQAIDESMKRKKIGPRTHG